MGKRNQRQPSQRTIRNDWLVKNGYVNSAGQARYDSYIASHRWTSRRREYFSRHPKRCFVCEDEGIIFLHHRTYERIGCELDDDLIPLCGRCHKLAHYGKIPGGLADRAIFLRQVFVTEGAAALVPYTENLHQARVKAQRRRQARRKAYKKRVGAPKAGTVQLLQLDKLKPEVRAKYEKRSPQALSVYDYQKLDERRSRSNT